MFAVVVVTVAVVVADAVVASSRRSVAVALCMIPT